MSIYVPSQALKQLSRMDLIIFNVRHNKKTDSIPPTKFTPFPGVCRCVLRYPDPPPIHLHLSLTLILLWRIENYDLYAPPPPFFICYNITTLEYDIIMWTSLHSAASLKKIFVEVYGLMQWTAFFYCCPCRWALEVKWWPLGQRLLPLSLWRQQCPGPLRPVSLSTASFLTGRSPATQRTYPSTNTTMYFAVFAVMLF